MPPVGSTAYLNDLCALQAWLRPLIFKLASNGLVFGHLVGIKVSINSQMSVQVPARCKEKNPVLLCASSVHPKHPQGKCHVECLLIIINHKVYFAVSTC